MSIRRAGQRLVVLDLDGTITKSDTLIPFLAGCFVRYPRLRLGLLLLPMYLLRFVASLISATEFKERLLTAFVGGLRVSSVESWARKFARRVIDSGCNSEVLSFIERSQARGDRLIVVSASPDIYVPLIAGNLGIGETVSTRAEVNAGRYTGRLLGENCKGAEKLRRLKEYLEATRCESMAIAVGDEDSDLPVLEWADEGWMVTAGRMSLRASRAASCVEQV